ncbi:hypothetical protein BS50DRAFT_534675 [Corynespora cassiicola Philippines]|uniref:Uncharacterized protein n=1 Tax=Corynespora cassiicola Philippines TaxID=1448308 RepID=A0A2T2N7E4_CORCC|nr:hypothetical protein BS50DRAFT_534675 [Corynespora cassiicola Philippines]
MARLQPFLHGMEHYAKVVEVLCNGTPYLSWIWAPIKLMLMVSVDCLDAFEKLIDAYAKIADLLPRFDRLAVALGHDHNFQALLALVYTDILEFHRRAYKFLCRKSWKVFFASMWSGFESRFGAILGNLAYHSELVDKEAVSIDISDAMTRSRLDEERWEKQEREWTAQKVRTVLAWLSTDDTPPEDIIEKHTRECLPDSCDWFLNHPKTKSWLRDGAPHALLWLYGKPGAGKSTICSSVVRHAADDGVNIFYYFCSYLGRIAENSSRLLRSVAAQIVQKHQDLAIHVYENYCQSHPVPTRKGLMSLLPELLEGLGTARIVVDGIDEWAIGEQKEALRDLTRLVSLDPSLYVCKILVASRDTLDISRILRKKGSRAALVSLSDEKENLAINNSIQNFIKHKLANLPDHFSELSPDAVALEKVREVLLTKSDGMFLWVRLVLDSMDTVYSTDELGSLVEELPTDLDTLYSQILERLCNAPSIERYGGVLAILGWICFARRPLHKTEILHGLAIRPMESSLMPLSVPIPQILDHCKPLIEERPDSTIVFVHFSITEFLLKSNAGWRISQQQTELSISFACATTVLRGLDLLDPQKTSSECFMSIASRVHRLLPYSLKFWVEHCLEYAKCGGSLDTSDLLPRRLANLQLKHEKLLQQTFGRKINHSRLIGDSVGHSFEDSLTLMNHLPVHGLMEDTLSIQRAVIQHSFENGEDAEAFATQNDRTLFSNLVAYFESSVLYLLTQDNIDGIPQTILQAFRKSYASTAFRCRFPSCPQASTGFASDETRLQHEMVHLHRVKCKIATCQWSRIGFSSKARLDAHNKKHHDFQPTLFIPPQVRRLVEGGESSQRNLVEEGKSNPNLPPTLPKFHAQGEEPHTPTPSTPITPMHQESFSHNSQQQQQQHQNMINPATIQQRRNEQASLIQQRQQQISQYQYQNLQAQAALAAQAQAAAQAQQQQQQTSIEAYAKALAQQHRQELQHQQQ